MIGVVVPFGGDDPYRRRALHLVLDYYREYFPHFHVTIGADPDPEFSRARAVNHGVMRLPEECDLIVINDADSLVEPAQLKVALALASEKPGLVRAYTRYRRLSRPRSMACVTPADVLRSDDTDVEWEQATAYAHCAAAIQRTAFALVGGYDPRFVGWGYEDMALELMLDAHWPDRRVPGDVWHLWHPTCDDPERDDVRANSDLYYHRYEPHRGDGDALLAVRFEDA